MISKKKTKIVATIGPASASPEMLEKMVRAGMSVCRINFSHGSHDAHKKVIDAIREINLRLKTNVPILADLQGPKLRIGEVENNSIEITEGMLVTFTTDKCIGNTERIYINYANFAKDIKTGHSILLDDGKISFKALETNKKNEVVAVATHGGILSSKKGVNLPDTNVSLHCITPKDLVDLDFALNNDVEWIGVSFVRSGKEIRELKDTIRERKNSALVVAKIEKPEAIIDLDNIIAEADAVMVARGDLGVEIPIQKVPVIQKLIVKKCLKASKPVIIATQMMESMIHNASPLRAEVNDVANSVMDGADALMLSGETSVGDHPAKVIQSMQTIIEYIEIYEDIYHKENQAEPDTERFISDSICYASCKLAHQTNASAIVTMTHSGYTAFKVSSCRPKANIYIFTDNRKILNMLNLVWGVKGYYYDKYVSTDDTIRDIKNQLLKEKQIKSGDIIINIASIPISEKGPTNMLKLSYVE